MRSRSANGLSSILSATGGIARLACAHLRRKGRDPAPVLAQVGLTLQDIADPKCRVAAAAQVRLLELAAAELEDTHFGLHLARDFELGQIGLVYYVMASSEHLADALANAARYCAINNEGVRLEVSAGRTLSIGLEYLDLDRCSDRHHAEFWVVTLVRIARALTGGRLSPEQIRLRHRRPRVRPGIDLGCAIDYGANRDEIAFPEQSAALRVTSADTHLNRILLEYADDALGRRKAQRSSLRARIEDQLVRLLPNGKANVLEVARRTGMSRRTLARALSDEGTNFSAVLSDLRQALAKRYLRDQDLPVSEIAWLLGYREVSSFSHAFSGWTGVTPRQFRSAGS